MLKHFVAALQLIQFNDMHRLLTHLDIPCLFLEMLDG